MVAQATLTRLVMVRIHVGQPSTAVDANCGEANRERARGSQVAHALREASPFVADVFIDVTAHHASEFSRDGISLSS